MAKAMIILVLLVAGGFAIIIFMGSRVVAPTAEHDGGFDAPDLPDVKGAAKKGAAAAKEAAAKAAYGAKVAADKAGIIPDNSLKSLKLEKDPIEVKTGFKTDVKITRTTKELKPMKLELLPARDSKLLVTGGEFKQGDRDTTITVEAQPGAIDCSLTIKGSDDVKLIVAVRVK